MHQFIITVVMWYQIMKIMKNESIGRKIYKHLMNGVSNMLPFVVAGGILIAVAFLIDTMLGQVGPANFGTNTPIAAYIKDYR